MYYFFFYSFAVFFAAFQLNIVSIAGISDLPELIENDNFYEGSKSLLRDTIGDVKDKEELRMLKSNSAVNFATRYQAPLLMLHGENDYVVSRQQSLAMRKAMKRAKRKVTYVELEDGTHYLDNEENRKIAFKEMVDFLSKHL